MTWRVLFVDDERMVLDALRRMLRTHRAEWDMHFVSSGLEALEVMRRIEFDVIVSDIKMPGMTGADLLEAVRAQHPQTLRFILSGQSEKELALRAANAAHQYFSKPCDATELKQALVQAFALREVITSNKLKEVVSRIDTLPSIPRLYSQLLEELNRSTSSMHCIGDIISRDMAMTSKILKLANSALYGFHNQISTAGHAVAVLGTEAVKTLVLTIGVFAELNRSGASAQELDALWEHSLRVASYSRALAEAAGADTHTVEDTFTAGLLHDIGKLIMMSSLPDLWAGLKMTSQARNIRMHDVEYEELGCSHSEIGAYLLRTWNIPTPIVQAVAWHSRPSASPLHSVSPLLFVHIANAARWSGKTAPVPESPGELDQEFLGSCGASEAHTQWIAQAAASVVSASL